nr:RecName: Full=L-amino-acid oxidase L2; Short=LAAO-L2; Short=LAO [Daboia russelii]
ADDKNPLEECFCEDDDYCEG